MQVIGLAAFELFFMEKTSFRLKIVEIQVGSFELKWIPNFRHWRCPQQRCVKILAYGIAFSVHILTGHRNASYLNGSYGCKYNSRPIRRLQVAGSCTGSIYIHFCGGDTAHVAAGSV
jgi:hypothetical protein